jgi:hypothetical protein
VFSTFCSIFSCNPNFISAAHPSATSCAHPSRRRLSVAPIPVPWCGRSKKKRKKKGKKEKEGKQSKKGKKIPKKKRAAAQSKWETGTDSSW